ncbi:BTE_HP_G0020410.mRNA.1.CDS.1 [Saccharomyces cerevisiae]|nr:BTE_HP_G0020410.mRNA.1.CDS.1 [Saccharomyces cerevisiae]CAI6602017.1 BTE_HP_G0020410.mRNA.1.CDS.1 [Saccharomyces cerevisiae]
MLFLLQKKNFYQIQALNTKCESLKSKDRSLTKIKQELESDLNQRLMRYRYQTLHSQVPHKE